MAALKKITLALGLLLIFGFLGNQGQAAPVKKDHVQAALISEVSSIRPGQPFWIALQMKMDPKWHTYWINAGDSGLATTMAWTLPEGFSTGAIQWPYPHRIDIDSLVNYGYEGEIYLLQEIRPPADLKTGQKVELSVKADWLVCEDICLPESKELRLSLPVQAEGGKPDSTATASFVKAREALPVQAPIQAQASTEGNQLRLAVNVPLPSGRVYFFPETPGLIPPSAAQTAEKTEKGFDLKMSLEPGADPAKNPLRGVLFAENGLDGKWKAVQIDLSLEKAAAKKARAWTWNGLVVAIVSAFFGGMILNLMPCVFPVLSIKVLGFVKQSASQPGEVKLQGLLFGLGVLTSFLLLAGLLLVLRAGGEEAGWGFQLQNPWVVAGLAILFFAIGLNLMGVFEIGTSLIGLGSVGGSGEGRWESFLSGVFATVVATPCTAPLMGSALGFALGLPAVLALAVFASLGLGMAFPYVWLSFSPRLTRFLPKPGAWMESFKQCMALPMFAAVIWLLWIFEFQVEEGGLTVLLSVLLAVATAAWIYGRWANPGRSEIVQWTARVAALVLVALGLSYAWKNIELAQPGEAPKQTSTDAHGLEWQPYSPELIEKLRTEGRPIYLDFTARWCATCQVNKKLVFGSPEVRDRLKELNVALVKGDWTQRDPVITRALESFDRAGVPLNVLYGKGPEAKPVVLPEVLTAGMVLDALKGF